MTLIVKCSIPYATSMHAIIHFAIIQDNYKKLFGYELFIDVKLFVWVMGELVEG